MKKESNPRRSRRKFLSWTLIGGASLMARPVQAMTPSSEEDDTVPMLTADGQLVQVPRQVVDQSSERQKAANRDILHWSETQNKSKP